MYKSQDVAWTSLEYRQESVIIAILIVSEGERTNRGVVAVADCLGEIEGPRNERQRSGFMMLPQASSLLPLLQSILQCAVYLFTCCSAWCSYNTDRRFRPLRL